MADYSWVDINSGGLKKAICMVAEKYNNGEEPTKEEIGNILHKTTQRSGLKNAPIMLNAVNEMAKVFDTSLKLFCKVLKKTADGDVTYNYDTIGNCAVVDKNMCVGISNNVPTVADFESLNGTGSFEMKAVLNLSDGKIYTKPVMA